MYSKRCLLRIINKIRINHDELIEDFDNIFLHLCYEFLKDDMDWDFFKEKLKQFEFESLVTNSLQTLINHETPLILGEKPIVPFAPYPPPFSLPKKVVFGAIVEVEKSVNQIVDPFIPSSFYLFA